MQCAWGAAVGAVTATHMNLRTLAICGELDCGEVFEIAFRRCPACASPTVISLARLLNREPGVALAVCGTGRDHALDSGQRTPSLIDYEIAPLHVLADRLTSQYVSQESARQIGRDLHDAAWRATEVLNRAFALNGGKP